MSNPESIFEEPREAEITNELYADSIDAYLMEQASQNILRPHQAEVMASLKEFFVEGNRHGYIKMPTGTGKTVVFVELSKALMNEGVFGEKKPHVLVVTPTRDLVLQTVGSQQEASITDEGDKRGFGFFAPDVTVGTYYGDTPYEQKKIFRDFDVVVTTYRSLHTLAMETFIPDDKKPERPDTSNLEPEDLEDFLSKSASYSGLLRSLSRRHLEHFDIVLFDEAHHVKGKRTSALLSSWLKDKVVIGFTATPDGDEEALLSKNLPSIIYEMGINEAIDLDLLSPVSVVGLKSGLKIEGTNIFDENGDYIDSRLRALAEDQARNLQIVKAAKIFSENGIGTIVSCIAGDDMAHPQLIAGMLNSIGVKAEAVHNRIKPTDRREIFKRFERGEIDVLTYIGVLGEGWDSQRAQALINARPTRSPVVAEQRLGRILRPGENKIAFAIDILDDFEGDNPPYTLLDVLDQCSMDFGSVYGNTYDISPYQVLIDSLKQLGPLEQTHSLQREYQQILKILPRLINGGIEYSDRKTPAYVAAYRASSSYSGLTDEVIERLSQRQGKMLDTKLAKTSANIIRRVYRPDEVASMLNEVPLSSPDKFFLDHKGQRWTSEEGLALLFSKRFPGINSDHIARVIDQYNNSAQKPIDWQSGKYSVQTKPDRAGFTWRRYILYKLYPTNQGILDLLQSGLEAEFKTTQEEQ